MTDYLRNRFSKQKIYLMAHSGGTFIGLQAAARAPEVYCAYIGVAQKQIASLTIPPTAEVGRAFRPSRAAGPARAGPLALARSPPIQRR